MMACVVVPPTVTLMEVPLLEVVPPRFVGSGNEDARAKVVGPMLVPNTINMPPWAIPELGRPEMA